MIHKYEQKFNSKNSGVKADESWDRYLDPSEKRQAFRERYDYSVNKLYGDVLDVGCSDGFGMYLMSKNPEIKTITGLEIHDKAILSAQANLKGIGKIVKGIGEDMPFKEKFDCIHCGHTLEHVFDDVKVLSEIRRLLKGIAVISVPIRGGISLQHVREYTVEGFTGLIKEHFDIIESRSFMGHVESLVVVCS